MATYQEQLSRLAKQKDALENVAGAIADALMPHINAGRLTVQQASDIMLKIIHNIAERTGERK